MNLSGTVSEAEVMPAIEGKLEVPGAVLRYRLSGPATAACTVVLENGWSGSFPYFWWLEQALAAKVRVLSYDRAGIGLSRSTVPLRCASMTQHLVLLLDALRIEEPVVVIGHSYGGLIGVLHAAQSAGRVSAIVQLDATPEFEDPIIDPSFRVVPLAARVLQLCALLHVPGPLDAALARQLPADVMARFKIGARETLRSLNAAIEEIRQLPEMRRVIAQSRSSDRYPRLVISAAPPPARASWLRKLTHAEQKEAAFRHASHQVHQRQAALHADSRWLALPYGHVELVADRRSADEIAARVFEFIKITGKQG